MKCPSGKQGGTAGKCWSLRQMDFWNEYGEFALYKVQSSLLTWPSYGSIGLPLDLWGVFLLCVGCYRRSWACWWFRHWFRLPRMPRALLLPAAGTSRLRRTFRLPLARPTSRRIRPWMARRRPRARAQALTGECRSVGWHGGGPGQCGLGRRFRPIFIAWARSGSSGAGSGSFYGSGISL